MEENNNKFEYSYSAPSEEERREIAAIRRQYSGGKDAPDKLERLRYLNAYVNNMATMWSLIAGVLGILIFGLGFAMVLEWGLVLWGILVAACGVPPMIAAYPIYCRVLERNREKYGEEILRLSDELLGGEEK